MAKFVRVQRQVVAARLDLHQHAYCKDCEQTADQTPIRYNDWFDAHLCQECERQRQEGADQTARMYKILNTMGHLDEA